MVFRAGLLNNQGCVRTRAVESLRLLAGFVLMPPTASLIVLLTYNAVWQLGWLPHGTAIDSIDSAASLGLGVAILAVVTTALAVVPGVIWLIDKKRLALRSLLALGAVVGNLPFAVIVIGIAIVNVSRGEHVSDLGRYWYGTGGFLGDVLLGIVAGVGCAFVFWVAAVAGSEIGGTSQTDASP